MPADGSARLPRGVSPGRPAEDTFAFAVIGDVEPKPEPAFDNLDGVVDAINRIDEDRPLDFVAGIGDVARNATEAQYERATRILRELVPPFYPIMGNEELPDVERFLEYASRWNEGEPTITDVRYVETVGDVCFVFATAEADGKNFTAGELDWIEGQVRDHGDRPVVLFVHAAPKNVYPEGKTMETTEFDRVLSIPNVAAVFSGHSHMSLDETTAAVRDDWGTQHVHVPGVERTKVGTEHVPRFRVVTVGADGSVAVETYDLTANGFDPDHELQFRLHSRDARPG